MISLYSPPPADKHIADNFLPLSPRKDIPRLPAHIPRLRSPRHRHCAALSSAEQLHHLSPIITVIISFTFFLISIILLLFLPFHCTVIHPSLINSPPYLHLILLQPSGYTTSLRLSRRCNPNRAPGRLSFLADTERSRKGQSHGWGVGGDECVGVGSGGYADAFCCGSRCGGEEWVMGRSRRVIWRRGAGDR
jgi:hypothetical protein